MDLDSDGDISDDSPPTAPENSTTKSCILLGRFFILLYIAITQTHAIKRTVGTVPAPPNKTQRSIDRT